MDNSDLNPIMHTSKKFSKKHIKDWLETATLLQLKVLLKPQNS